MSRQKLSALAIARWLAPWMIALVALVWVFYAIDLHALEAALAHAPLAAFVLVSALMQVLICIADTFAMRAVFSWFRCRVPYWDLFFVRASTYLLALVNYHLGQAAIVGYLHKSQKVPLLRASGVILFIIGINVGTLLLLASAGAPDAPDDLRIVQMAPLACAVGFVLYALLLKSKPTLLSSRALFAPLFEMGIVGHAKGILVRLPHVTVLLAWHFISLRMFGVDVPPNEALLYLPTLLAVQSLPVNVNGFGMAQLVAIACFARYAHVPAGAANVQSAQEATVLAYSLGTAGVSIGLQLVLGCVCLKRGTRAGLAAQESGAVERAGSAGSASKPMALD